MPVIKPFSVPVSNSPTSDSGSSDVSSYSRYFISSAGFPSFALHGDLSWRVDIGKLYKYDGNNDKWQEIDWQAYVQKTLDWEIGAIEINPDTGNLVVGPGLECLPVIGGSIVLLSDDSYKYWIAPGQSVILYDKLRFPIVTTGFCSFDIIIKFGQFDAPEWLLLPGGLTSNVPCVIHYVDSNPSHSVSTYNYVGHFIGKRSHCFSKFTFIDYAQYITTFGTAYFIDRWTNKLYSYYFFSSGGYFSSIPYWIGDIKIDSWDAIPIRVAMVTRKW